MSEAKLKRLVNTMRRQRLAAEANGDTAKAAQLSADIETCYAKLEKLRTPPTPHERMVAIKAETQKLLEKKTKLQKQCEQIDWIVDNLAREYQELQGRAER